MATLILAIDGKQYNTLPIINLKHSVEILDGEGSGRLQNWNMFRDPEGYIENIECQIGLLEDTNNVEFISLQKDLKEFGLVDFKDVSFITPTGTVTQKMYGASFINELVTVQKDGVSYWGQITIKFIAKKPKKAV